jgi:hypothetical protein
LSQRQGILRQRDVPVLGALAAMPMALATLTVNVGTLQGEGFMKPEAQAIDGGKVNLMVQRWGRLEKPPALRDTEHGRKAVCGLSPNERQGGPVTLEDMQREASDAPGAEAHGSRSEVIAILSVQAGGLKLGGGEKRRRFAQELREQAALTDGGWLGTFALATELESRTHLLTQWGHERSPFVS